jgi:twitching motility protein PilJ
MPPPRRRRGDAAVLDDLSPAGESAQLSTAEFPDSEAAKGPAPVDESSAALAGDVLVLPVLGARTTVQHQRILAIMLGLSLVVLTAVTFYSLNQADKVAQQVAATGQSLMQSQRLAKSVSQALVGSPQAFAEVKESADVLAKTVRGLSRKERRHRDGPAKDPDAGGQRAAHHQPPVVRPAGNRRNRVVAQAAAKRPPAEISAAASS